MDAEASHARRWPRSVIFDLDGTLVDSAPDIQAAINAGFTLVGVAPFDLAQVKTMIGGGGPAAVAAAARLAGLTLTPAEHARVYARFSEVYAEASALGRGLFPAAHAVLAELVDRSVGLAIVTNKSQAIADIAVGALGIAKYFRVVIGAREGMARKPDEAPVLAALAVLGGLPVDAVMIGDSAADIGAARAAGLRSVALAQGYAKIPVAELGADVVVAGLAQVPAALAELAGRSRTWPVA